MTNAAAEKAIQDAQTIENLTRQLFNSLVVGDWPTFEGSYSSEVVGFMEGPGMKVNGWEEMKLVPQWFMENFRDIQCTLGDDWVFLASGDLASAFGTFDLKAVNKTDGKAFALAARNTLLWQRKDSRWQIVHEHSSLPAAMG